VHVVSTATRVPETWDLDGDDARETLTAVGKRRLLRDSFVRLRAADGTSHARSLAFMVSLCLVQGLIVLLGVASSFGSVGLTSTVARNLGSAVPGPGGAVLTDAVQQARKVGEQHEYLPLFLGLVGLVVTTTFAMGQLERGLNRIYGVERDRPFLRKYTTALLLALTAGVSALLSLVVLMGGAALRNALDLGETFDAVWHVARWPLGVALAVASVALLFEYAPRRRQPEASWLAFGAGVSVLLFLLFMAVLAVYMDATDSFGATYGPIAGTIGVLLWAFLTAIALFLGLAFAAQLEAVRAGVTEPRLPVQEDGVRAEMSRL
jgi:YihY family inner membrane protein